MSFLKFWKKDKPTETNVQREDAQNADPEAEKRRVKHSLSISRSGRFKQKNRQRGQILDKPELFDQSAGDGGREDELSQSQSSANSGNNSFVTPPPAHNSSPHCRNVNNSMASRNNIRIGQSVVT